MKLETEENNKFYKSFKNGQNYNIVIIDSKIQKIIRFIVKKGWDINT